MDIVFCMATEPRMQYVPGRGPGTHRVLLFLVRRWAVAAFPVLTRWATITFATRSTIGWAPWSTTRAAWATRPTGASHPHVFELLLLIGGQHLVELLFDILFELVELFNLLLGKFELLTHGGRDDSAQFKAGAHTSTASSAGWSFFLIKATSSATWWPLLLIETASTTFLSTFFKAASLTLPLPRRALFWRLRHYGHGEGAQQRHRDHSYKDTFHGRFLW